MFKSHHKTELIVFLVSLLLFAIGFHCLSLNLREREIRKDAKQNHIILESLRNRFKLFLDYPVTIGLMGAENFSNQKTFQDYGPLARNLLKTRPELIGLNLVDAQGKIVKVYPEASNLKALGHITQNLDALMHSFERGEPYWFSPPFKLFQSGSGFALYFPIIKDKKLMGWFATVLSTDIFIRNFELVSLDSSFATNIVDETTNLPYFSSGLVPPPGNFLYESQAHFLGRSIRFVSWCKEGLSFIPTMWTWLAAFLCSLIVYFLFRYMSLRKRSRNQLNEISMLLKLTSREAMSKLIDLQSEIYKLGSSENAKYVMNIIEQLDLLQSTANSTHQLKKEMVELLPIFEDELDEVQDLLVKKSLVTDIPRDKIKDIQLYINKWLFKNFVVSNILTHSIFQAETGSTISVTYQRMLDYHVIQFHTQRTHHEEVVGKTITLDRRLKVAKTIMNVYDGDVKVDEDLANGLTVRVLIPV